LNFFTYDLRNNIEVAISFINKVMLYILKIAKENKFFIKTVNFLNLERYHLKKIQLQNGEKENYKWN